MLDILLNLRIRINGLGGRGCGSERGRNCCGTRYRCRAGGWG